MIEKLSDVRFLVSQIVLEEEDDDQIARQGSNEQYRNSGQKSGDGTVPNDHAYDSRMQSNSFRLILASCLSICVKYIKIYDDMNYWKDIITQSEKKLKNQRKNLLRSQDMRSETQASD